MRSVHKVSSHVLWKRDIHWRRYKIQEILSIGKWCLSPFQSRHLGTSHSSFKLPSTFPSYFPEAHWQSEISSLSNVTLVLGKARSCRAPNLGSRGAESPGWFDVSPKTSAWDIMHELSGCWWSCQLPVAHSCSLLNHPNSFHGRMFKLKAKFDADSLLYSLSHFECVGHTVHMLPQQCLLSPLTSTVKSSLF